MRFTLLTQFDEEVDDDGEESYLLIDMDNGHISKFYDREHALEYKEKWESDEWYYPYQDR